MIKVGILSDYCNGLVLEEYRKMIDTVKFGGVTISDDFKRVLMERSARSGNLKCYQNEDGIHLFPYELSLQREDELEELRDRLEIVRGTDQEEMWARILDIEERRTEKDRAECSTLVALERVEEEEELDFCFSAEEFISYGFDPKILDAFPENNKDMIEKKKREEEERERCSKEISDLVENISQDVVPVSFPVENLSQDVVSLEVVLCNNHYDMLLLYARLYSFNLVPQVIVFEDFEFYLKDYYLKRNKIFFCSVDVCATLEFQERSVLFFRSIFETNYKMLWKNGLFPMAIYVLTSSVVKFKDIYDVFNNYIKLLRIDYNRDEVQGDPIYVALCKSNSIESYIRNYIIEDTSLMIGALGFKMGSYIKDLMELGVEKLYTIFGGSKTLWISTMIMSYKHVIFLAVVGVEGTIGPVSRGGYSFDRINYIDGSDVSMSEMPEVMSRDVNPRIIAARMLKELLVEKDYSSFDDASYKRNGLVYKFKMKQLFIGRDSLIEAEFLELVNKYVLK